MITFAASLPSEMHREQTKGSVQVQILEVLRRLIVLARGYQKLAGTLPKNRVSTSRWSKCTYVA